MKYIIVSGGVVSGLGKGIVTASLSLLLKSRGYKVAPTKIDMYLNVDAGTIRPQEHGEVFVTHDGIETDEDLGHYERFINENLSRASYITTGQVYQEVIRRERAFEYEGEDVEAIPHLTDEITRRINLSGDSRDADVTLVELGGTVGEYQNGIFFEATRIMKLKNPNDVIHVHVTYLPFLSNVGELKSKPAQTSVHILNGMGIHPDIIVARSENLIDQRRLERLALFCNIESDKIFSAPDMPSIYEVPLLFHSKNQHLATTCLKLLHLKTKSHTGLAGWKKMVKRLESEDHGDVRIAMVGKYFATGDYKLSDSYVSVIESLKHAGSFLNVKAKIEWIDSEALEKGDVNLNGFNGIIVPQGWGSRGVEGKLIAAKFARENNIPYLGLCFGMQMAAIEFARNVLGLKKANTTEADSKTSYPIIDVMPDQEKYLNLHQYGGTIRLGAWPCIVKKGTLLEQAYLSYGKTTGAAWFIPRNAASKVANSRSLVIYERHRHRYEFNNKYKAQFEKYGFVFSGTSPDGKLVEAIELNKHKFFVGTQF
ncbi:MAG: CTP synthase, partial [Candidatus Woesebacteria bacterium]|nr:CTP synthase [Candidatus Woesebacteria bacterium]